LHFLSSRNALTDNRCDMCWYCAIVIVLVQQLQDDVDVLTVSRFTAVALLFMYLQLLFFQLKSHAHLYEDDVSTATCTL
jgi:Ca2+/H+ antiporter